MKSTKDRVAELLESGFAAPGAKVAVIDRDRAIVGTVDRETATQIIVKTDQHGVIYRFWKDTLAEVGARSRTGFSLTRELLPLADQRVIDKRIYRAIADVRYKVDRLFDRPSEKGLQDARNLLEQVSQEVEAIKAGKD